MLYNWYDRKLALFISQVLLGLQIVLTSCKILALEQSIAAFTKSNQANAVDASRMQNVQEQILLPRSVPAASTQPIVKSAYLRQVLPDTTLAYFRLPSLWWPLGGVAIGNMFDEVVQTIPHVEAVSAIRSGILNQLISEIPTEWRGLIRFLISQINSPVEVALLAPSKSQTALIAMPELLITMGVNQNSIVATNLLFKLLAAKTPGIEFPDALQDDGSGKIIVYGKTVDVVFDVAKQRLFLRIALPTPGALPFVKQVVALKTVDNHPMWGIEKDIDVTGQGLLLWVDLATIFNAAEKFGLAANLTTLRMLGLADARSLTVGMGGSGGKQRLKFVLEMPQVGIRNFLPLGNNNVQFTTANELDMVLLFNLFNASDLVRFENSLKVWLSNEEFQFYQKQKAAVLEVLGLTAEQLLNTFGSERLIIHDQAGYYFAVKLSNEVDYKILLRHLIQQFKLKYETRELLGTIFHHLIVPPFTGIIESIVANDSNEQSAVAAMGWVSALVKSNIHLYWIERQGYLVFAPVPQVLMDILYSTSKVNVGNWLQNQGLAPTGALFIASTRSANIPKLLYEMHLLYLSYWGDFVKKPIDLFSLPSAYELHLPNSGAYSIQFSSTSEQLAFEMVYESSPFEALLSMGLQTLATVGIAASVVIPSFLENQQDEQVAPVTVNYIQNLQGQIVEFKNIMGRFPAADEIKIFLKNPPPPKEAKLTLIPDTGSVVLNVPCKCQNGGGELILVPSLEIGGIRWQCEGSLEAEQVHSVLCPQ